MEVFQAFFGDESFASTSAGAAHASTWSAVTAAPLRAKEGTPYLGCKHVDSNTRIKVYVSHSPDGRRWVDEPDPILDTGDSADATTTKLVAPEEGFAARGAFNRFRITVEERDTPNSTVTASPELWIVYKPF